MGYDAMVPGNVEFFYNRATIENLFSKSKFPLLIANIYDAEWGERAQLPNLKPYIIKNINGLKVGIIGMTYHWMSKVANHPQWSFGLRTAEVQDDVNHLRKQEKVDLVILVSHMGWKTDVRYAELVSDIDVIVGAHTHDILYRPSIVHNEKSGRDVLVVQCGSHGKMVGQLDLKVNNRQVTAYEQTLFPIRASGIKPDPEIAAYIEKLRAPYKAELEKVIGTTTTLLYRQGTWQSTADNLVVDALRARTKQDVAIKQPGRYGAAILPGPITVEDIYNLIPAESPIYQMKFSGQELRMMLESAIDNVINEDPLQQVGGYMWRYSGIELSIDLSKNYPNRIQKIVIDKKPIINDKLYTLAEFDMFFYTNPNAVDLKKTDKIGPHEVIAYVKEQGEISPGLDHRISDHHGNIMADHPHIHKKWEEAGRNEYDLDKEKVFIYRGRIDKSGRLANGKWH
ncbi:MAG: 5'-nucleotidase C-terminal domain-containing protein, partial [Thioalkalispiraceae bacterium]|jgi:sulfur-oxidizing protein SoxB